MCEGSEKRHRARLRSVPVPEPLHPAGVWLLHCERSPLVDLLISWDLFVGWAGWDLPDLDGDVWSGDVLFYLEWPARLLRGCSSDGGLRVGEDRDPLRCRQSSHSGLQRPGEGSARPIMGALVVAHMGLMPTQDCPFLHTGNSIIQPLPVCENC